ncbi:MAG: 50S ribosomal protein L4 [Candidatus Kaiserbacteria bacterium]|nr:50S ribosomal protein L4 [Candidatus Kaiserbacteria bacterium]
MNKTSLTAPLYTQDGKERGTVDLPEHLFALPWSPTLMHQAVTSFEHNRRSMTAHTKGRSEVRGGGRKPWRQKGTGRARHGSIRSPLWVGGGVTFGPSAEKDYRVSLNRKVRAKAFFIALSERSRSESIVFLSDLSLEKPSTKTAATLVDHVCPDKGPKHRCLFVFAEKNEAVLRSFANIPGIATASLATVHARDILLPNKIVFVDPEKTLSGLEERSTRAKKPVSSRV